MANGYEEFNPAEQAAREAQEKALAATKAAEEEQAFIDQGAGGGFVAGPEDALGGLLTGNGGAGVTGNGTKSETQGDYIPVTDPRHPYYQGEPQNGQQTNGQQTNGVPTIPTTPTTPQPGALNGQQTNGQNAMGLGNQGYTGGQGFVPGGNGTVTDGGTITDGGTAATNGAITGQLDKFSVGQSFDTGYGAYDLTPEDVSALNSGMITPDQLIQNIIGRVEHKEPLPSAPTDIAMSSEQDLSDEDFRNVWDRVNSNAIPMAQLGNFLKFETTQVVVGTDSDGNDITASETIMSSRSRELLNRAIAVESENRIAEQEKYERDLAKAELTGDFRGAETLEKRKTNLQEKLAKAEATGMFGEEATLAKQKLDLEERIDYANRTGMYKDPNTNRYEKTLLLKKMEQDKELADLEMQMQETALMGADPDGVVTFAKEQWLDQIQTDKTRYDDAVTQLGVENDMRMLEILGTSKRDAYVYDEEGNIQFDSKGNPILQTLAARRLAEDMLTGQADREDIKARTAELKKSNREAEKLRLMEIMVFDENKAQTFAARQFDEKVRASKKAEELKGTEQAFMMDFQRQQLASQNLALMLQNPAAFGALTALTGGGMPQQLQGLGMQVPSAQQPSAGQQPLAGQQPTQVPTPQQAISQMFQGSVPTLGQLGELDPQAMQTLTSMLGYSAGIRPQQLGQAAASVTPGGMQTGPAQVFGRGLPTGRRA